MINLINILTKYHVMLLNGAKITLIVSILTIFFGLILGTLMAFMKMSKIAPLRWLANVYVEFIRGTPVLVQISIVFYGLPMMGIDIPSIMVGSVDISRLVSGIVALTINTTAYVCEIVRSGIQSIDKGQTEGALALGMTNVRTRFCIVLPQAMKNILPALGNELIVLLKETSISGYIGLTDLTRGGDIIRSQTYSALFPLLAVAAIYLVIVCFLTYLVGKLERRLRTNERK